MNASIQQSRRTQVYCPDQPELDTAPLTKLTATASATEQVSGTFFDILLRCLSALHA